MKIDLSTPNPGFQDVLDHPNELIVVDANFYLPPNRTDIGAKHTYPFEEYRRIWVEPMHRRFPNMAIHEAVLAELVDSGPAQFARGCIQAHDPPKLKLLCDANLNEVEEAIRKTKEQLIAPYTNYDPVWDNKNDRGEVKSLAYMGTVGYIYFSSNDKTALRLIEEAKELGTTLDDLRTVHFYEGIYYLCKLGDIERNVARKLYRYQYYLTRGEKESNPPWAEFYERMDELYAVHNFDGQA